MGKLLILIGAVLIIIGLLFIFKIPIPFLGKLPGDIYVKGENVTFYFPVVTCLLLSIILSFIIYLFYK